MDVIGRYSRLSRTILAMRSTQTGGFQGCSGSGMILKAMSTVIHFSKRLSVRPVAGTLPGIAVRQFAGDHDIPLWLELRNRAFARARPGVLSWDEADFAREMLERPWWSPDRVWFAMAAEFGADQPLPVGTVALAGARLPHQPWPRCIGWPCFPRGAAAAWPAN